MNPSPTFTITPIDRGLNITIINLATLLYPEHLGEIRVHCDIRSEDIRPLLLIRPPANLTAANVDDYALLRVGRGANVYPTVRGALFGLIGELDSAIAALSRGHLGRCGGILASQRQFVEGEGERSHRYRVWESTMWFWNEYA